MAQQGLSSLASRTSFPLGGKTRWRQLPVCSFLLCGSQDTLVGGSAIHMSHTYLLCALHVSFVYLVCISPPTPDPRHSCAKELRPWADSRHCGQMGGGTKVYHIGPHAAHLFFTKSGPAPPSLHTTVWCRRMSPPSPQCHSHAHPPSTHSPAVLVVISTDVAEVSSEGLHSQRAGDLPASPLDDDTCGCDRSSDPIQEPRPGGGGGGLGQHHPSAASAE